MDEPSFIDVSDLNPMPLCLTVVLKDPELEAVCWARQQLGHQIADSLGPPLNMGLKYIKTGKLSRSSLPSVLAFLLILLLSILKHDWSTSSCAGNVKCILDFKAFIWEKKNAKCLRNIFI